MLVVRHDLSFIRDPHADHLCADVSVNDMRFSHIAHAEHETELSVSLTDGRRPAKQQRLGPHLRPSQFRKDDTNHKGLFPKKSE